MFRKPGLQDEMDRREMETIERNRTANPLRGLRAFHAIVVDARRSADARARLEIALEAAVPVPSAHGVNHRCLY